MFTSATLDARVKVDDWNFCTPPLQYKQAISGVGCCVMSDSPLCNVTRGVSVCVLCVCIDRLL